MEMSLNNYASVRQHTRLHFLYIRRENQFFVRGQFEVLLNTWQIAQCWGTALPKLGKLEPTVFGFRYPQNPESIPQVLSGA